MPLVSVIVPLYNKAERIRLCVESILAQTFSDFELIVVDDGSTDGSAEIIDELAGLCNKIKVEHQKNQGVSAARNRGIELSAGEGYLCFVDADDTIAPDFLKTLIDVAQPDDDIISESPNKSHIWRNEEVADYIDTEGRLISGTSVWGKLYKVITIKGNNLKFDTNIRFGEDTEFNLSLWPVCKSIKTVKCSNYEYYHEEGRVWELSAEEIRAKISNLIDKYGYINEVFHSGISYEKDVNITLSLYRFEDAMNDEGSYFRLYSEYYPEASMMSLYNDMRCSPLIRGITAAKNMIGCYPAKAKTLLKRLSQKYGSNFLKIKYPYRSHRIIGLLLGFMMPWVAYIILKCRAD